MSALPPYPGLVIKSDEPVWRGRFPLRVVKFRHRRFDGAESGTRTWELWQRGRAAALLPYDPVADAVVLIEQFRLPALAAGVDPVLMEVPAGLCDGDETPEETIKREMQEEIGLGADLTEPIGDYVLTPGGADERCALFVGRVQAPKAGPDGIVGASGLAAENEDIRIRVLPADEAIGAAFAGRYNNPIAVLGLFWLASQRTALRQRWAVR